MTDLAPILALDPGTTTGWALVFEHGVKYAGSKTFTGTRPEKLSQLREWLFSVLNQGYVRSVIFERPFARGQAATRMLWGMAGVIEECAWTYGLPVLDQEPQSIKKWALGFGGPKATKELMTEAAKLYFPVTDQHAGDAVLLGMYALEKMEYSS